MKIETKYSQGDTVWAAEVEIEKTQQQCPDCLSTKIWHAVLASGEELDFRCPSCTFGYETYGTVPDWRAFGHVAQLTIGTVRIEPDRDPAEQVAYMCEETGVGSGRIWYEDRLFPSYEEASAVLPSLIEKRQQEYDEQLARNHKLRKNARPGSMAAYYRAQIRDAEKEIEKAKRGLEREAER